MGVQRRRPTMPGYGIEQGEEGMLDWADAERRLAGSHDYFVATVWPDGRPHVMPVWGAWLDGGLWFSSGLRSRKIRNLRHEPRCTMTTDDARFPVVLDGVAEIVTDLDAIGAFLAATNAKYHQKIGLDFLDPAVNATVRVVPVSAFSLDEERFGDSPTRWEW